MMRVSQRRMYDAAQVIPLSLGDAAVMDGGGEAFVLHERARDRLQPFGEGDAQLLEFFDVLGGRWLDEGTVRPGDFQSMIAAAIDAANADAPLQIGKLAATDDADDDVGMLHEGLDSRLDGGAEPDLVGVVDKRRQRAVEIEEERQRRRRLDARADFLQMFPDPFHGNASCSWGSGSVISNFRSA